jgi:hypothetical protein
MLLLFRKIRALEPGAQQTFSQKSLYCAFKMVIFAASEPIGCGRGLGTTVAA